MRVLYCVHYKSTKHCNSFACHCMTLVCLVLAFNTHHDHICTVTFAFALPSCLLLPEDVSDDDIISMVFTLLSLLLS